MSLCTPEVASATYCKSHKNLQQLILLLQDIVVVEPQREEEVVMFTINGHLLQCLCYIQFMVCVSAS